LRQNINKFTKTNLWFMKIFFITYNGALEPLIQSQGIPYLKGLSDSGVRCFLLSFEKRDDGIKELKKELASYGIEWFHLRYHKKPTLPATLFDILLGIFLGFYIVISRNIDIIHCRATVPALMGYVIARLTGRKFLFDVRGLMAEEYVDGGMWKRNGFLYKVTSLIEKKLLQKADSLVVLTENIKGYLMNGAITRKDITVIPCCVDLERFNIKRDILTESLRERYKLENKFVFLYTGSIGTWYLLEEMIDFFIVARSLINNAHFLLLTHLNKDVVRDAWRYRGLSFDDITIDSVEFKDMPAYIKLGDAGIFFIKPCFSKRSSCPIKFAEYLASGLPVVINSGIGDTDKIVERYRIGIVIDRFEKACYINAVKSFLELIKDKSEISFRCHKVAGDLFSLEQGVYKYFEIYRGLECN